MQGRVVTGSAVFDNEGKSEVCIRLEFAVPADMMPQGVGVCVQTSKYKHLGEQWGEYITWKVAADDKGKAQACVEFLPKYAGVGWPCEAVESFFEELEFSLVDLTRHRIRFTRTCVQV